VSWPSDTLAGVYLFLFAFGLIFGVASLLLGGGREVGSKGWPWKGPSLAAPAQGRT
jgi:hypothetical protein